MLPKQILLKNTNYLANDNTQKSSILIHNQKIEFVEDANLKQSFDETFELNSFRLLPGFIDIHNHGAIGIDVNSANVEELHKVSQFLAKNGVTAWLPTLVPDSIENYQKSIDAIDELIQTQVEREPAARVLGVHYEGPFVNEKQCGALRTKFFKTFANRNEIDLLPRLNTVHAVHLITLAPEIENGIELIQQLTKQRWIVSIGHTRASIETLDAALSVGAQHLTHFFNAMTGLHHRDVGVAGWGLANEQVTFDIIADKIHVHPAMLKLACRAKTPAKTVLISDSVSPAGLGDGDFEIWGEKISVANGRTQNERGSIAGSVITMHDAVKNMLALSFTEAEVARMASLNPAKLLKVENQSGSIEVGKQADLVAIDDEGNIKLTIVAGRVAFDALSF